MAGGSPYADFVQEDVMNAAGLFTDSCMQLYNAPEYTFLVRYSNVQSYCKTNW